MLKIKDQQILRDKRDKNFLKTLSKTFKIQEQESLKNILKNINKNLLSSRSEQEIERRKKRLNYLNNYKLNSIIKRTQRNFNNSTSLNRDKCNNRDKQNRANINLKNFKKN